MKNRERFIERIGKSIYLESIDENICPPNKIEIINESHANRLFETQHLLFKKYRDVGRGDLLTAVKDLFGTELGTSKNN